MTAGLNLKVSIIQNNQAADDSVGGSIITGTVVHQDVWIRIEATRPTQAALDVGLEVNRVLNAILVGKGITVNERDELQVTWPETHPYFNERFRVTGIQVSSERSKYGHTEFTLGRIERSRSQQ